MSELIDLVLDEATDKMERAVVHTKSDFATVRTGRASSALVERLMVNYYGADTPLQQLASFSVPEARQLLISPFDKGSMGAIEKAIQQADLGLNPGNDGHTLRLIFPPLTEERRKELVRLTRGMAEDGRVAIRNMRRAARHDFDGLKADSEVSEDDVARGEKALDVLTHDHEKQIDQALEDKEQELLEV